MKLIKINTSKSLISILSVWLFAIYPVLVLYAHNIEEVVLHQAILPLIFSLLLSTILFGLWRIILKNNIKASLTTVLLLLIFWNYGLLYMGMTKFSSLKHWHLIPLLFFIYFNLVYFIAKTKQQKTINNLNTILLLPISLLIVINLITILPAEFKKFETLRNYHKVNPTEHEITAAKDYPDIYLIILDEYASFKTIKEEWGYDNSEFAGFLREKGFFVAEDSEWRYILTEWNMASLLNLDYLTGPIDKNSFLDYIYDHISIKGSKEYEMLRKARFKLFPMISNNILTNYLKELGYKIIILEGISQHYKSFTINNADISFAYQNVKKLEQYSSLIDAFSMELIRVSIISPFYNFFKTDPQYKLNYVGTKFVVNYLKTKIPYIDSPKFIYAHIMCPHTPFVFDREGNYIHNSPSPKEEREGKLIPAINNVNDAYLEQYIYMTNEVKNIVNSIQGKSPVNPVIIIQCDHSPRPGQVYLKDKTNAFNALNVVYFPDGDYQNMYDSIAPINTFRVVLNKYFGKNYKMLEDR
jgi:hypothetical protein